MHLKRNVGVAKAPMSSISPTTPPPIPTEPMEASGSAAAAPAPAPAPPKPSSEKATPFANVSFRKSPKLAALEASGSNTYVLVSSPTVMTFLWTPHSFPFHFFSFQIFCLVRLFHCCMNNYFFARLAHSEGTEQ